MITNSCERRGVGIPALGVDIRVDVWLARPQLSSCVVAEPRLKGAVARGGHHVHVCPGPGAPELTRRS